MDGGTFLFTQGCLLNRRNIAKHPSPGLEFRTLCVLSQCAACRLVARLSKINLAMSILKHVYPKTAQPGMFRQRCLMLHHQESLAHIYPKLQRYSTSVYDHSIAREVTMKEDCILTYKYCFQP